MAQLDKVLEVEKIIDADSLAMYIANEWHEKKQARGGWDKEKRELRNYLFATDTNTTTNATLPWKNKTTRPKLCQLRDNLHANYMAALFPNDDWLTWEPTNQESASRIKADKIKYYMHTKVNQTDFKDVVSQLVYDYIDYGNAFADVVYEKTMAKDESGADIVVYEGPRLVRISPFDVIFDPTASSFNTSYKITREILTLGDLKRQATKYAEQGYKMDIVDKMLKVRQEMGKVDPGDIDKSTGFVADGFGSLSQYYKSGYVEVLIFEGDLYDSETGKLYEQHKAVVVDRSYLLYLEPINTYSGMSTKRHVGWRKRPDNAYAMGPLDNLVGIQYRIDHLENLKADVFDLIAHPPLKIKGYVEDFDWKPLEQIVMDSDADVDMLRPDTTALNADFQIDRLEQEMEEMAGAPKQAMGIRTPGEKTAYEVQTLQNAAGRIFESKIRHFEEMFLEPLLNAMLEVARKNMGSKDVIRLWNDLGALEFLDISKEDIIGSGKVRPKGARHFASQAKLVQELTQLMATVGQDQSVAVHISGKKIAELMEDVLGLKKYDLVQPNIRIMEQLETQQMVEAAQEMLTAENQAPPEEPISETAQEGATTPGRTQQTL